MQFLGTDGGAGLCAAWAELMRTLGKMTIGQISPRLAIPALTFRADGRVDEATTLAYTQRAGCTWLDTFLLSGTTTEGASFTVAERARVLDLWLAVVARDRLLACCWQSQDVEQAVARGIRPLVVMRGLTTRADAWDFLSRVPPDAYVYSHPLHTQTVLDAPLIEQAHEKGVLPAGAKIIIIPPDSLPALRAAGRAGLRPVGRVVAADRGQHG